MATPIPGSTRTTGGASSRASRKASKLKKRRERITKEQKKIGQGVDFTSKRTPTQTKEQAAEVARQRADREARGQKPGTGAEGIGFVPPRAPLTAEVRRVGTREEVVALEDRPGVVPPELTPEIIEEEGSIFGKDTSIPESIIKSTAIGIGLGVSAYTVGRLALPLASRVGTRLLTSRGLSIPNIIRTAKGGQLSRFVPTTGGAKALIGTTVTGEAASISSAIQAASQIALRRAASIPTLGRIAVNTKTAASATSFLTKLASTATPTRIKVVLGVLAGTLALGSGGIGMFGLGAWGEKEGLEGLGFAYKNAVKAEDDALADEIRTTYQESRDLVDSAEFKDFMPFVQLPETIRKINIKIDAADALVKSGDALRQRRETETGITSTRPGTLVE